MKLSVSRQQHVATGLLLSTKLSVLPTAKCSASFTASLTQARLESTISQKAPSSTLSPKLRRFPANAFANEAKYPEIPLDSKYVHKGIVPDLSSTRPALLNLPDQQDPQYQSKFQYFLALGKAYGRFYLAGIKNVWANSKTAREISKLNGGASLSSVAKYPQNHSHPISYNEYELSVRNVYDLKKLVPFGLVFAICGEFTPFVILFIGSAVVPNTCRIPRQREQDLQKYFQREDRYMQEAATLLRVHGRPEDIPEQESSTLLAYLHNLTWFSKPLPVLGSLHYNLFIRRRLAHHYNEILCSTILIQREGGFSQRPTLDVWDWGRKYGLYALRNYARNAVKEGKALRSDEMKQDLLSAFEREARYILDVDWTRLNLGSQWLAACNSTLNGSNSPDVKKRREELNRIMREQESVEQKKPFVEQAQGNSKSE